MPASPKRAGGGWAAIPRSLRPVPLACTVFLILSATALVGMVWRTPTIDSDRSPPLVRVADVIGAGQQGGQAVQLSPSLLPLRPPAEARPPVQIQVLEPRGHLRPSVNVDEDFCAMVPAGEWGEGGGPPDPSVAVAPLWYNVTVTGAVGEEAYHHYQICVVRHDHPHELSIALRTLNKGGDADLYLSTTRVRPTASSSTWISASIGDDVVSIASNNPDWGPADSVMYIGVLGRTASLYNLTVNVRSLTGR